MDGFVGSSGDGVDDINHASGGSWPGRFICPLRYLSWLSSVVGVDLLVHRIAAWSSMTKFGYTAKEAALVAGVPKGLAVPKHKAANYS